MVDVIEGATTRHSPSVRMNTVVVIEGVTKDKLEVMPRDVIKGALQSVIEVIFLCILSAVSCGLNLKECNLNLSVTPFLICSTTVIL